jgi:hypothetical protein
MWLWRRRWLCVLFEYLFLLLLDVVKPTWRHPSNTVLCCHHFSIGLSTECLSLYLLFFFLVSISVFPSVIIVVVIYTSRHVRAPISEGLLNQGCHCCIVPHGCSLFW